MCREVRVLPSSPNRISPFRSHHIRPTSFCASVSLE
jgi:hypothetical protein